MYYEGQVIKGHKDQDIKVDKELANSLNAVEKAQKEKLKLTGEYLTGEEILKIIHNN